MNTYPPAPDGEFDPYYDRWTANMDQCTHYAQVHEREGGPSEFTAEMRASRWEQFDRQIKEDLARGEATTWQPRSWRG
jgi:hypothetical protein